MSDFDPADFVDRDFQAHKTSPSPHTAVASSQTVGVRAPSREEVDSKVVEAQQKLTELKRAQEELERERTALEETRRRQMEFHTGREETINHLTRGVTLLEEAEFTARRDAEQLAKTLTDFRDSLGKLQSIHEETWTKETFNVELTRALTAIENARMEWNSARLKFPVLSGQMPGPAAPGQAPSTAPDALHLTNLSFGQLCRLGLALTWPLAVVVLIAVGVLLFILFGR